jgi:hypothetical protein
MLKVGTKLAGNWGAMFPLDEGEIIEIHGSEWLVARFRDAGDQLYRNNEIIKEDWYSTDSRKIGVYLLENG